MRKLSMALLALMTAAVFARPAGAMDAPVISSPAPGTVVPGATAVHFAGTASPDATVDLIDTATGAVIGTTNADAYGGWSADESMSSGAHTAYAIERDAAVPSESVTFDVDAVRPIARISSPRDQTVFGPGQTPQLSGTATDDRGLLAVQIEYWMLSKMVVRKNVPCACDASPASWSDAPALTLPGYYVAKVTAIDVAGNRSETLSLTFFDAGVHETPELPQTPQAPQTPKPPIIQSPIPGKDIPGANSPPEGTPITVAGIARPGQKIDLYETRYGGGWWGTTFADGRSGRWTMLVLADGGRYGIQARATNAQGRVSPLSARVTFSVDDLRPQIETEKDTSDPKIFLPTEPVVLNGRTADNYRVAAVNLEFWLGDKLVLVANASCPDCATKNAAAWTYSPRLSNPGYYYVNIRSIDQAGNHSVTDSIRFVKTV